MNRSIIVVAVMPAGCASPAVFRDPKTGQSGSMQCNATTPGIFPIIAQHEIDDCTAAYGRMGWQKQ
ncbi:hypothetical protein PQR70_14080 [Paraburkholderia madseniana]|uniref:hypothetical protein n=1 Tax=Paraburkholderia madseniana TaxID=2599607 RepID=UPI0038B6C2EE